jgi:hypothetical protein
MDNTPILKWIFIWLMLFAFAFSCKPKPDVIIDGKPYYVITHCVKEHKERKFEYHYGVFCCWHSGGACFHFGNHEVSVCDEYATDTIPVK